MVQIPQMRARYAMSLMSEPARGAYPSPDAETLLRDVTLEAIPPASSCAMPFGFIEAIFRHIADFGWLPSRSAVHAFQVTQLSPPITPLAFAFHGWLGLPMLF
jgi:hypothetical protein